MPAAGGYVPEVQSKKMEIVMNEHFVQQLLKSEEQEGLQAWSEFFLNIPLVRQFIIQVPRETATACLNEGH